MSQLYNDLRIMAHPLLHNTDCCPVPQPLIPHTFNLVYAGRLSPLGLLRVRSQGSCRHCSWHRRQAQNHSEGSKEDHPQG